MTFMNSKLKNLKPLNNQFGLHPYLWLGLWSLGGEGFGFQHITESKSVISLALEKGIRYFDTAQFYAHGKSDDLLSPFLKSSRKDIFVSSKAGLVWNNNDVFHDGSEKNIRETLYKTLDSLNTDYIDLFSLHWPDSNTPIEVSLNTLKVLQKEKLIRFWGVSNFSSDDILNNLEKGALVPHQIHHNPINKKQHVLNAGNTDNTCINCAYSPFEQGLLSSSKSSNGINVLGKKDCRRRNVHFKNKDLIPWLKRWQDLYTSKSLNPQQVILNYLLQNPQVDAVITGARNTAQLKQLLDFENLEKTSATLELFQFLDGVQEK
jgi:aryl-alcohol dehydrogenase-like predicted oxidoreductase